MIGRAPTLEDLIVPNAPTLLHSSGVPLAPVLQEAERERIRKLAPGSINHCRTPQVGLKQSRLDCTKLGMRERRNHDARRTMISLARAGGATKDLLEWVTHGPPGDVIDGYTTLPWETLCQQVASIKIERKEGKVIELRAASSGGSNIGARIDASAMLEAAHHPASPHRFPHRLLEDAESTAESQWGVQDSETLVDVRLAMLTCGKWRMPTEIGDHGSSRIRSTARHCWQPVLSKAQAPPIP